MPAETIARAISSFRTWCLAGLPGAFLQTTTGGYYCGCFEWYTLRFPILALEAGISEEEAASGGHSGQ